jgi:hypothetical protein
MSISDRNDLVNLSGNGSSALAGHRTTSLVAYCQGASELSLSPRLIPQPLAPERYLASVG